MTYYCGYCNHTPCICEPGVLSDQGTPTIDQRIKAAVLAEREALSEQAEREPMKECRHCGFLCKPNSNESRKWYPLEQSEHEPVMGYERLNALREGEQNGAEDAYFFVRPENDTPSLRKMFCQGFERGFHKGLKYAAPVRTKDLTDDEIDEIFAEYATIPNTKAVRAVIAADREKNK